MTTSRNPAPGQQETIEALLSRSSRSSAGVPLRSTFVKSPTSPLAHLVHANDSRALDLMLLHRACASSEPWDVTLSADVWARTLGLTLPHLVDSQDRNAAAQVSKTWRRLEARGLVLRERHGRHTKVTVLDESGNETPYLHPERGYSRLSYAYWTAPEHWYLNLTLAAKAVLLISLQQRPEFEMPEERVAGWYGISRDTWRKGSAELASHGLLAITNTRQRDWLAAASLRGRSKYRLTGAFARPSARGKA